MFIYFNIGRMFPYAYETILSHLQGFLLTLSAAIVLLVAGRIFYKTKHQKR
jgi:hypothetical protein